MDAAGEIDEDTLFWKKGMQDWRRLAEIPELEQLFDEE